VKNSDIRVLFVDDAPDALELAEEYLKDIYEYQLETALNADEAIKMLQERNFEVVVTDMRMEKDDSGFDVLDAVNKNQLTTFVIIITANDSVEGCRKAFKNKAWDYISKNSTEYNPWDEVDKSIQKLIFHLTKRNGHEEDKHWVNENRAILLKKYPNRYIGVLNRDVIADANSKDELIELLLERQISPYLTYIESFKFELSQEKPTIFVEGPTDIVYLEKAIDIFNRDDLKNKIKIDTVGDSTGKKNNGEQNMKNAFAFLKENPDKRGKNGILFLFDNDVKELPNKGKNHENIYVSRMGKFKTDNQGVSGVESFFDIHLYEEGLKNGWVNKTIRYSYHAGKPNEVINYKINNKTQFANWIIENRDTKETFREFQEILDVIDDFLKKMELD